MTTGLVAVVVALAVAGVLGLLWRSRRGRLVSTTGTRVDPRMLADGAEVTLLQFSSAQCGPCAQVRAVCADLAGDAVGHVEVDAGHDLDAVRALDVWRVPTLFVVDAGGTPVWRAVGVPKRADLADAVVRARAASGRMA